MYSYFVHVQCCVLSVSPFIKENFATPLTLTVVLTTLSHYRVSVW